MFSSFFVCSCHHDIHSKSDSDIAHFQSEKQQDLSPFCSLSNHVATDSYRNNMISTSLSTANLQQKNATYIQQDNMMMIARKENTISSSYQYNHDNIACNRHVNVDYISRLDHDTLTYLLCYLDAITLFNCVRVSKRFYGETHRDLVWKSVSTIHFYTANTLFQRLNICIQNIKLIQNQLQTRLASDALSPFLKNWYKYNEEHRCIPYILRSLERVTLEFETHNVAGQLYLDSDTRKQQEWQSFILLVQAGVFRSVQELTCRHLHTVTRQQFLLMLQSMKYLHSLVLDNCPKVHWHQLDLINNATHNPIQFDINGIIIDHQQYQDESHYFPPNLTSVSVYNTLYYNIPISMFAACKSIRHLYTSQRLFPPSWNQNVDNNNNAVQNNVIQLDRKSSIPIALESVEYYPTITSNEDYGNNNDVIAYYKDSLSKLIFFQRDHRKAKMTAPLLKHISTCSGLTVLDMANASSLTHDDLLSLQSLKQLITLKLAIKGEGTYSVFGQWPDLTSLHIDRFNPCFDAAFYRVSEPLEVLATSCPLLCELNIRGVQGITFHDIDTAPSAFTKLKSLWCPLLEQNNIQEDHRFELQLQANVGAHVTIHMIINQSHTYLHLPTLLTFPFQIHSLFIQYQHKCYPTFQTCYLSPQKLISSLSDNLMELQRLEIQGYLCVTQEYHRKSKVRPRFDNNERSDNTALLSQAMITDHVLQQMCNVIPFTKLTVFGLSHCNISDAALRIIGANMPMLRQLKLEECPMLTGIGLIQHAKLLPYITKLQLPEYTTDDTVKQLHRYYPYLEKLNIYECTRLTSSSLPYITASRLPCLRYLCINRRIFKNCHNWNIFTKKSQQCAALKAFLNHSIYCHVECKNFFVRNKF